MSSKVLIAGFGGTGKAVSQLLSKHDVFITGTSLDFDYGTRISALLREADFSTYLCVQRDTHGKRRSRPAVNAFEHSASCAVLFGPSAQSPFADECLRLAIMDRVERTRGEFRVIPVLLPGASKWLKSKHLINEMCGFKTRRPVRFEEVGSEKEYLHQLILAIRGVDLRQPEDWQDERLRDLVRRRAENALNVDWTKLTSGVREPLVDIITGVRKERAALDYNQAVSTCIPGEGYAWRLPRQHVFSAATGSTWTPVLTGVDPHALPSLSLAGVFSEQGDSKSPAYAFVSDDLLRDELAPDEVKLLILQLRTLSRQGRHPEALRLAERATVIAPDYWRAWISYGGLSVLTGKLDKGDAILRRTRRGFADDPKAAAAALHGCAGIREIRCKLNPSGRDLRTVLREYEEALELDNSRVNTRACLVINSFLARQISKGKRLFEESLLCEGFFDAMSLELRERGARAYGAKMYRVKQVLPIWLRNLLEGTDAESSGSTSACFAY